MKNLTSIICFCTIALVQCPVQAALSSSDLLNNSPFVFPEGWSASGKPGAADTAPQYVFKGVYSVDSDIYVNIADSSSGKSFWIRVGETVNGIKVVSYDSATKKATITANERELALEIPKPKVNPSPVGVAVNSPGQQKNFPPGAATMRPRKEVKTTRPGLQTPPFATKNNKAVKSKTRVGGSANSSSSTSDTSTSAGSSGSSTTTTTTSTATDNTTTSTEATPGSETSPSSAPPSPPSFVPTIPDSLKNMIETGDSPSSAE